MDLLLPAACAGCPSAGDPSGPLCPSCEGALPRLPGGRCPLCQEAPGPARCPACAAGSPALDACGAAVAYGTQTAPYVRRFKYPRPGLLGLDPGAEAVCVAWVRTAARRLPAPRPDAVVPIPLHPRRLRERAFNPAAVLARAVARGQGARFDAGCLERVRDTPSQTGLDPAARRRNVAGAFALRRVPGPSVWLVDDVVTTGATLAAAAQLLRAAGVARVAAVCAARTLRAAPAGVEGLPGNG